MALIRRKQGTLRIMVGRTRKLGRREPNGRIARAYHNPKAQVASQPGRQAVQQRFREMAEAGTRFGRMMLNGQITPAQHAAGERYGELVEANRKALMAPAPHPSGMDYERAARGMGSGIPDSAARMVIRDFTAAFNAIENLRWQFAVMHHAVHDKPVSDTEVRSWLISGLDRLVAHFGIDSKMKIVHVGNASS